MKKLLALVLLAGCVHPVKPIEKQKDECDQLAQKYGANVIVVSDFATGERTAYASLWNDRHVWRTSKQKVTDTSRARTVAEARQMCAEQMRPGIIVLPDRTFNDNPFLDGSIH